MGEKPRKFAVTAALLALLLPAFSAMAQTFSAADLLACCNSAYCPVHHRQGRNFQTDKSNCDSMGIPVQHDCSLRACDAAPNPAVGLAAFILVAPVGLRGPSTAGTTPALAVQFSPYLTVSPLTPPPRTSLS